MPAAEALARRGVAPYEPGVKEGIALVNGAPLAPALTACARRPRPRAARPRDARRRADRRARRRARCARTRPASARSRATPARQRVHATLVALHAGAADWSDRPQPPVSFRVLPQVHGAALDLARPRRRPGRRASCARSPTARCYLEADGDEPAGLYPSGNFHAQALSLGARRARDRVRPGRQPRREAAAPAARPRASPACPTSSPPTRTPDRPDLPAQGGDRLRGREPAARGARERPRACDGSAGQEDVQAFTFLAARASSRAIARQRRADRRRRAARRRAGAPRCATSPLAAAAGGGGERRSALRARPEPSAR